MAKRNPGKSSPYTAMDLLHAYDMGREDAFAGRLPRNWGGLPNKFTKSYHRGWRDGAKVIGLAERMRRYRQHGTGPIAPKVGPNPGTGGTLLGPYKTTKAALARAKDLKAHGYNAKAATMPGRRGFWVLAWPKAGKNPDDHEPVGLPKWAEGLVRMIGPGDRVVFVDWKNPRWGVLVLPSGKKSRAKFYAVYGMDRDGNRHLLRRVLRDELMSSYIRPNHRHNPGTGLCDRCRARLSPTAVCPKCGVWHGDPCPKCKRRGYHARGCPAADRPVRGLQVIGPAGRRVGRNPGTDMGSISRTPDFKRGLKLYNQIHGCDPTSVKRTILRMGPNDNKVTGRVVLVSLGRAPAESYEPPRGSRKEGRIWVHPYDHKPEKVVTVDGKTIITMPGTHAVKAGPDGEAWIHG